MKEWFEIQNQKRAELTKEQFWFSKFSVVYLVVWSAVCSGFIYQNQEKKNHNIIG